MRPLLCCVLLSVTVSCGRPATPEPSAPADVPQGEDPQLAEDALAEAAASAKKLGSTLKKNLMAAMEEGGPVAAFQMCSASAQGLTQGVADETDTRVGRSSLRLRNPKNAPPDWVGAWLTEQGERKAEGVSGFERIASNDQGRFARVLIPIAVEAPCLNCHGEREQLQPEVRAGLAANYPDDAAVGYAVGDLRGALWAEAAVAP